MKIIFWDLGKEEYCAFLIPRKKSGMMRGSTTASCNSDLAASSPAISFHPTPGLWLIISPVI